jgi:hypothetical protein
MFTALISNTANAGMLSLIVTKSRASIVPVMVRFVTVDNSVVDNAVDNPPEVTFTVLDTCACPIK